MSKSLFSIPLLLLLSACGSPSAVTSVPTEAFSVRFSSAVNGQPFHCGQDYTGVGTSDSTIKPRDFRFYVSAPRLVDADGKETPIRLEQDGKWQLQNLALLDFEDATQGCEGTTETHAELKGEIPAGSYKPGMSLRFELGVPFALNHADATAAPSPLNLTSLFWSWRSGYKFARLDVASTGQPQGYFIHLGSTGCMGEMTVKHEAHTDSAADTSATQPPASCSAPNRATITLTNFDAAGQRVEADLGKLLQNTDVDVNQPDTPAGCMSGPDDSDCQGIFRQLGLDAAHSPQAFFALKPR